MSWLKYIDGSPGSSLTRGTAFSLSNTLIILRLVLAQRRKTLPDMTEILLTEM